MVSKEFAIGLEDIHISSSVSLEECRDMLVLIITDERVLKYLARHKRIDGAKINMGDGLEYVG